MRKPAFAAVAALVLTAAAGLSGCSTPGSPDNAVQDVVPATIDGIKQGSPLSEPKEIKSKNGSLEATFDVRKAPVDISGAQVEALTYSGSFLGPTFRVQPGDSLNLTINNELDKPTNYHTHGVFTSPAGISDNVFRVMGPGSSSQVQIDIPTDVAPGTYWYHAHYHGLSEEQVFGGLVGVLKIEGLVERLPLELQVVPDKVMALRDVQVKNGAIRSKNIDSNAPTTRTVNGLVNPVTTGQPGQPQLLRLLNMSADIWYNLELDGADFTVIAQDGNPVNRVDSQSTLVMPPGKRFDVLVKWDKPGKYALRTLEFNTGPDGDVYPETQLAVFDVSGDKVSTPEYPTTMFPDGISTGEFGVEGPNLQDEEIVRKRRLEFGEDADKGLYFINNRLFDENYVNQYVKVDTTEEWTLVNTTTELHPFHIHVNDFQVMSVNGKPYDASGLQDVVMLPMGEEVVIRIKFRRYLGTFPYHCHILAHEDAGMMGVVAVTKDGIRPADSPPPPPKVNENTQPMDHSQMNM